MKLILLEDPYTPEAIEALKKLRARLDAIEQIKDLKRTAYAPDPGVWHINRALEELQKLENLDKNKSKHDRENEKDLVTRFAAAFGKPEWVMRRGTNYTFPAEDGRIFPIYQFGVYNGTNLQEILNKLLATKEKGGYDSLLKWDKELTALGFHPQQTQLFHRTVLPNSISCTDIKSDTVTANVNIDDRWLAVTVDLPHLEELMDTSPMITVAARRLGLKVRAIHPLGANTLEYELQLQETPNLRITINSTQITSVSKTIEALRTGQRTQEQYT